MIKRLKQVVVEILLILCIFSNYDSKGSGICMYAIALHNTRLMQDPENLISIPALYRNVVTDDLYQNVIITVLC